LSQSFLLPIDPPQASAPLPRARTDFGQPLATGARDPFRDLVRALDEWMRRRQSIIEFTDDPNCILRISLEAADRALILADGAAVRLGDPIIEIHFWNERLPQASSAVGLGWGGRFGRRLRRSFDDLAVLIERDPRYLDVVAIRGRLAFAGVRNDADCQRFGAWFGFEVAEETRGVTLRHRLHDIAEDFWLLALTYTFNPGALPGRSLVRRRDDMWISRAGLTQRYGARGRGRRKSA